MLVLSRKKNESIIIDSNIVIVVVELRGDKVRLGVEAPKEVSVHRHEVYEALQRAAEVDFERFLSGLTEKVKVQLRQERAARPAIKIATESDEEKEREREHWRQRIRDLGPIETEEKQKIAEELLQRQREQKAREKAGRDRMAAQEKLDGAIKAAAAAELKTRRERNETANEAFIAMLNAILRTWPILVVAILGLIAYFFFM